MKILDKIKNAIFEEEEEFDEEFDEEKPVKKEVIRKEDDEEAFKRNLRRRALEERLKAEQEQVETEEPEIKKPQEDKLVENIVKQIDVEKTVPKRAEIHEQEPVEDEEEVFPVRASRKTPIIFDESDFDEGVEELKKNKAKNITNEPEPKKNLYGGYREDKTKEKFKPSPNISPVYGLVEVSPVLEKSNSETPKNNHVYVPKKPDEPSLDDVRQKAFGNEPYFEEEDDLGLLYDMEKDDKPAVSKVTLGDAEEYFDDLGLEYNVDYTDKKAKSELKNTSKKEGKSTRSKKNKELTEKVEEEIKQKEIEDTGEIETLDELEITKEQIKPRTAEEIKKIKKIEDADLSDEEKPDEKNLYDLIDMMYDSE